MKVSSAITLRVSKIVQKNKFVKDILHSVDQCSGKVLLVGGAVRDLFLDKPIKDLDFEVYGLTLDQLQNILQKFGPVSLVGKSFGVLRLHGLDVDWSLPRKDSSGRHPFVAYDPFMKYQDAFIRRDLTINAMGIDMKNCELIDPFGGLQDLEHKILRAPDLAFFGQDPLRLLRVMQFASRFEMYVDDELTELCRNMDISTLSVERIEQEFKKLFLQGVRPSIGLEWLQEIGKFKHFFQDILAVPALWSNLNFAARLSYVDDEEKLIMMYACMFSYMKVKQPTGDVMKVSKEIQMPYFNALQKLVLSEDRKKSIVACLTYAQLVTDSLLDSQLKWLAYWLAPEISIRCLSRFLVIRYSKELALNLAQRAGGLGVLDKPEKPLLSGKDFLDIAHGAQINLLVKKAYELQINHSVTDRQQLKELLMQ